MALAPKLRREGSAPRAQCAGRGLKSEFGKAPRDRGFVLFVAFCSSSKIRKFAAVAAIGLWVGVASSAVAAPQFPLVGDERLNQIGSGLPGTPWDTPTTGIAYDGALGLSGNGNVPLINYNTGGPNQFFDFTGGGQALDFMIDAELASVTYTPIPSTTFVTLTLDFQGTNDGLADLVITDPLDGNSVLLEADFVAGTLNGSPVPALSATATFDINNIDKNQLFSVTGFFGIDPASTYASLFDDGVGGYLPGLIQGGVDQWEIGDADGMNDFDDILAAYVNGGFDMNALPASTSEAQGTEFLIADSLFTPVPEPGSGLLIGLGLLAFAVSSGRREV